MFLCSKISLVFVGFFVCGVDFFQNVLKHENWRDLWTVNLGFVCTVRP